MELGSSSSSSNSPDQYSLNGLKFGKKIYFEDAGVGVPPKSGGGSTLLSVAAGSGLSTVAPPKKGRSGVFQGGEPPRCQVEGCKVDLSDAKTYYSRHKVCGMHSKSPRVIVAGLEQRFCQQCSRFHQLPEFDQGKRSCRRRLAGHNERRRKPPAGSLLTSRYANLSSSIFGNNGRPGGFLMDFTTCPKLTGRDPWPATRSSEQGFGNRPPATGKFLPLPWQSNSEHPPPDLFLLGSANRTSCAGPVIPSGECFTGVSDSSCALSLLSNQPWDSRNQPSSLGVNNFLNVDGSMHMIQPAGTDGAVINHFPSTSWSFKANVASSSVQEMRPDLVLGQISQPAEARFSAEFELVQQSGRQYMEVGHSRGYDSSVQHMHWSL